MMITESEMYWLTRMDYFQTAAEVVGVVLSLVSIAFLFISIMLWRDRKIKMKVWFLCLFVGILLFIPSIGSTFIPNTKEMCAIKLVPLIVNDEQVQELPNKVVELANEWLDELRPKGEVEALEE
jgi:surface polysaccharide O-acyltransferase-like enzyme